MITMKLLLELPPPQSDLLLLLVLVVTLRILLIVILLVLVPHLVLTHQTTLQLQQLQGYPPKVVRIIYLASYQLIVVKIIVVHPTTQNLGILDQGYLGVKTVVHMITL